MNNSMKTVIINFCLFALGIGIFLLVPIGLFVYEEVRREWLIMSYAAPSELLKQFQTIGTQRIDAMMKKEESMVCFLYSYNSAADLSELNPNQRDSLPKSILPSQDLAWYLIFMTGRKQTRIYLLDTFGTKGIDIDNFGCLNRGQSLAVMKSQYDDGTPSLVVIPHFSSKRTW